MKNSPKLEYQGELTPEQALSVLPDFTSVRKSEGAAFIASLTEDLNGKDFNRFLGRLRNSFSEFLYDEFPELEQHYRDHLFLIATLLKPIEGFEYDFSHNDMVIFGYAGNMMIFNLRGTAEGAIEKLASSDRVSAHSGRIIPADTVLIGISFSAFDRAIDRWVTYTSER